MADDTGTTHHHGDSTVDRLRQPPHSVESEQGVLGGLLLNNAGWDHVGDVLTESDFYRYEHQRIFSAIAGLIAACRPADVLTVYERLEALGHVADKTCDLLYLNQLAGSVPGAGSIRRYAEVVRERALLRKLIAAGDEIVASAFNAQGRNVMDIVDQAESKIMRVGEEGARGRDGFVGMPELSIRVIDRISELAENGGSDVTGTRTGFYDLDRSTAGLQSGDLVILAARPSMGKSSLAMNIAENVAVDNGLPVVVFSMEMGAEQLALRMVGSQGGIDQQHLRTGRLSNEEWGRLTEATEKLSKAGIFIDESPGLSIGDLRARARRQSRLCGGKLGLIVVDYLQLMSSAGDGGGRAENRATEVGEISRGLKGLAKELQCPVMALSQLNRSVEARPNKRPLMSDLRESGAIEQDADVIMFIYRDDYYNADSKEPGVAEIIIAKQRCGPVGTVRLGFQRQWTKFTNLAPGYVGAGQE